MLCVHEMDCLREETVPVSGRSDTQSSVGVGQMVTVQRGSVLDVRVQSGFCQPFCSLWIVQFLESGEGCTNDSLSSPDYPPDSFEVRFGSWAEPDSYWRAEDSFNDGRLELFQQLLWQVELPQLVKDIVCWVLFHNGLNMIVVPASDPKKLWAQESKWLKLQLQCCSWWWAGGEQGGFFLKSTIISTVLSVLSSRLRLHQTASSLTSCLQADSSPSWMRPISVVSSANFRKLDRGVFRCAGPLGYVGEEQWGENAALRSSSADCTVLDENVPSLTSCCLSVRKLLVHWQMEVGMESCVSLFWRVSGMIVLKADLKFTNRILT